MRDAYPVSRLRGRQVFENGISIGGGVHIFSGAGAPVDGTSGTGAGTAGPGSLYVRTDTGKWYTNGGTKASPVWKIITSAA